MKFNLKGFLKDWMLPLTSIALLFVFLISVGIILYNSEKYTQKYKSQQLANLLIANLKTEIEYKIRILNVLSLNPDFIKSKQFEQITQKFLLLAPKFHSINFINTNGVIERVYPVEPNRQALGRNLLQREDVRDYLIASRDSMKPYISHKLMTFQQVEGYTLYIPLKDETSKFVGWLNAVVDIKQFTNDFFERNELQKTRIVINWRDFSNLKVDSGDQQVATTFSYSYTILNQNIDIAIGFGETLIEKIRLRDFVLTIILAGILLAICILLLINFNIKRLKLRSTNQKLSLKNTMLSSVTHDLANPLYALKVYIELALETSQLSKKYSEQINNSLQAVDAILKSAKAMHLQDLKPTKLKNTLLQLNSSLSSAIELTTPIALTKKINFEIKLEGDEIIWAEAETLTYNVFVNILTNAIKFSEPSGLIKICVQKDEKSLSLIFENSGKPFTEGQIAQFHKDLPLDSIAGTQGEIGSGLGLMQIKMFMQLYAGRLEIKTTDHRNQVILHFLRFDPE